MRVAVPGLLVTGRAVPLLSRIALLVLAPLAVALLLQLAITPDLTDLPAAPPVDPCVTLPDAFASLIITDVRGGLLREIAPDARALPVSLDDVPPIAIEALIAAEDRRFRDHPGIDVRAVARAAWQNLRHGAVTSGASTITMQVARLLRPARRAGRRSLTDKLAEAALALRLEHRLQKRRILELWLALAPFGNRTRGIEAAARLYFGKRAGDLTAAEATFLVGLPQGPGHLDPFRHPERARARHRRVLGAMVACGALDATDRDRLLALPLRLEDPRRSFRAPHLVEQVLRDLDGATAAAASARPVEVRTTLDPELQATIEGLVRAHLARLESCNVHNAAVLVVENAAGRVLAHVGSADFWDARIDGQVDGTRMLRQPGSALKPFTYALALASRRHTPATILADLDDDLPGLRGALVPVNYDGEHHGPVPLRQALASSYNIPPVRLVRELGVERLLRALGAAGFESLDRTAEHYGSGLTLGNGEVRLSELVRAYAGLARGGSLPELRRIAWLRTAAGDTVRATPGTARPMGIEPAVAHLITDILSDPVARAPAFGRDGPLELPFPCAVKTGTTKDYRDNWAIGYTPRHTVGVWVGNFDGTPMRRVSGVSGAGPLFHAVMTLLGSGGEFERPPGIETHTVCAASGALPGPWCPGRRSEQFLAGTVPVETCSVHQMIALDVRTGERATAATPRQQVEERLFTVHPPLFHAWMHAHGMPLPPGEGRGTPGVARTPGRATLPVEPGLAVLDPPSGTRFQIDPRLRPEYQRVLLRAAVPPGLRHVAWCIDGRAIGTEGTPAFTSGSAPLASWQLAPGRHRLELRATRLTGERVRSAPAFVLVTGKDQGDSP
ncbi:MAG: penicillin-binding protein 1C [Candidatus Eiseniibacteriota bacterium]|jgi:penicillin-binding protein 1C